MWSVKSRLNIILVLIPIFLILFAIESYGGQARILMFLWQGETSAEKGFKDTLSEELPDLKIDYTILDTYKSAERLNDFINNTDETEYQLIYSYGSTITSKVAKKFKKTPIVFDIVFDPIWYKIIESWDEKQPNLTGASNSVPATIIIQKIQEIFGVGDIGLIFNPLDKKSVKLKNELDAYAVKSGFELLPYEFKENFSSLKAYLDSIRGRAKCVYLPTEYLVVGFMERIFGEMNQAKIPSCVTSKAYLSRGGLLSVTAEYYEVGKMAGKLAAQILKGVSPEDLTIRRPSIDDVTIYVNSSLLKRFKIEMPKDVDIKYIN